LFHETMLSDAVFKGAVEEMMPNSKIEAVLV
jgi:hypothetical protein